MIQGLGFRGCTILYDLIHDVHRTISVQLFTAAAQRGWQPLAAAGGGLVQLLPQAAPPSPGGTPTVRLPQQAEATTATSSAITSSVQVHFQILEIARNL